MKKLMKAIAFATVMCMLLSTAAFATIANPEVTYATKTLNISITENGNNEQVSLLILKTSASLASIGEGDILYIDQAAANGSGTAAFTATLDTTETVVDIYSGNATYASSGAATAYQKLASVSLVEPVTEVAIVKQESGVVEGSDGVGVFATVDFTAVPDGYTLSKMVWALETEGGAYVYTNSVDLKANGYEAIASVSGLKFAAKITNATQSFTGNADAIFLFVNTAGEQKEAYSDDDNKQTHIGAKND